MEKIKCSKFDPCQSKWGRHFCRPHSYQRVVFLSGEPFRKHLASDVPPSNELAGFSTGARASIRFLFQRFQYVRTEVRSYRTCCPRYRDRSSILASVLKRLVSGRSLSPSIVRLPNVRPIRWISDRVLLKQPALRLAEAFVMTCLKDRVDNHHRVEMVSIFLWKSRPKPCFPVEPLCPSDELKLRRECDSIKGCNPDLSTFPQITCGRAWITQQFVANSSFGQLRPYFASRFGRYLLRSRCASSLRRRAFSLIKPSASC